VGRIDDLQPPHQKARRPALRDERVEAPPEALRPEPAPEHHQRGVVGRRVEQRQADERPVEHVVPAVLRRLHV
jgi:hypothetical protein